MHGSHYSRVWLRRLAFAGAALALVGCDTVGRQGALGNLIDRPAPPVAVTAGGAGGALLGSAIASPVPGGAVDAVVAPDLRNWLTADERQALAGASEAAAIAATGQAVGWLSRDGSGATTAAGDATAIGNVYRSDRGRICRDVRQRFDKGESPHAATVTLCRETQSPAPVLWVIAAE